MAFKVRRKRKKRRIVSNGVKKIIAHLENCKIEFKQEHRFTDCRDKLPLPFDFVIYYNGEIRAVIEYNGQQHYEKIRRFGGRKALTKQQAHDLIKMEYCRAKNIPFLVISYESKNVEELCDEFFARVFSGFDKSEV